MKKIFSLILIITTLVNTNAQELIWHTNFEDAVALSKLEQKPLMLFFTGSDWCGWCTRLQKEVFENAEFKNWAKEKVILVELDYPRSKKQSNKIKKQNNELQQFFAVQGYPTVWFVKATINEGKWNFEKLGSTGYLEGGFQKWFEVTNSILSNYSKLVVNSEIQIKLIKSNSDTYEIPCLINDLPLKLIFDTGASDVSISLTEALFMFKNGQLTEDDIIGRQNYKVASGEIEEGYVINIKKLQIDKFVLTNVRASVSKNLNAPLLLGQSALSKLGKITIDYNKNLLIIN